EIESANAIQIKKSFSTELAHSVEKLFAATASSQKAENCSPLVIIHQENLAKLEGTRMLFCQI
ncbi:hypothetical protein, partial [Yoonia sp.]|uniref:hypothetical protein n=1 Tax=Yoonia sp. TaxID=2212373 RepID=UPI0025F31517